MAWISALDSPLFIGRVDLKLARIELFTTLRLHQILLERGYDGIELLLDPARQEDPAGLRLGVALDPAQDAPGSS
jgi:hypothetical protein